MAKLAPLEEIKKARPCVYVYRAAAATLRSHLTGATPGNAARAMFGNDPITDYVLRAAVPPAEISGTPGWAASLGGVAVYDVINDAATFSAGAELISRGLKLNMDRIAEYRVPGRLLNAAAAGQWISEGQPSPVRALSFSNTALLHPHRLQVNTAYTEEMAAHSNIEAVVRQTLGEAVGLALDLQLLSADAGDATKPPGIFITSDTITPSAGGGTGALDKDLEQLFGALASYSAGKTAVIIAAMPQAVALKRAVGPKFDYDIIASTSLAPGTVGVVEVGSFVSGFSRIAEFGVSAGGSLHFEDTAPAPIVSDTGVMASPVKSLFQTASIGLKTILWGAWGLRAVGHAQWISGATW